MSRDDRDGDTVGPPSREELLDRALAAPILNGGFDSLVAEVHSIHKQVTVQGDKLDDVHRALYEPDTGIYARLKDSSAAQELENAELRAWRDQVDRELKQDTEEDRSITETLQEHTMIIHDLKAHRDRVVAVAKWLAVGLASGALTLFFTWLAGVIGG